MNLQFQEPLRISPGTLGPGPSNLQALLLEASKNKMPNVGTMWSAKMDDTELSS